MLSPDAIVIRLKRNQFAVFSDIRRFAVLVAGRRFGKTYLAIAKLIQMATSKEGSTSWYVAPTYRQAKMIAWKVLKNYIPEEARAACNETDLSIMLKNGSEISLKGADNPDSLRGVGLDLVILDEYQDMDAGVWGTVIRPMLATTLGKALFIGTPKGFNHFYDLYMDATSHDKTWGAYHFTTLQGGYVPLEEVLEVRNDPTITLREFKQEWEASFENLTGRVYECFSRLSGSTTDKNTQAGNIRTVDYNGGTIYMGLDFNINPMTASLAQKIGSVLEFFDEISINNSNTQEMCEEVKRRYPGKHIICYPDPAGDSGSTKATVGTTDYTILRKNGITVWSPGHPYKIVDRVNTVNAMLKSAAGVRRIFFDPLGCPKTIKAFDGLCYKAGTKVPDKDSGLDHYCDNVGYLIMGVMPLKSTKTTQQRFRP